MPPLAFKEVELEEALAVVDCFDLFLAGEETCLDSEDAFWKYMPQYKEI